MNSGIYVHIPFCIQKCRYCDFVSKSCTAYEMQEYQNALCQEIRQTPINQSVDTIFFGGGTPSVYPQIYIEQILVEIEKNIYRQTGIKPNYKKMEITLECNPGTLSVEKLLYYKKIGINRLSIGLQSSNNDELRILGRIHTYEEFIESYNLARKVGFSNINIDLMSAIPKQTIESYKETLNRVIKLQPEHISAYSLIVEPETPFYEEYAEGKRKYSDLPDEDTERKMYYLTKEILERNGYFRYEISNYAKKGYECRHNIKYWTRQDYYGFGISASSLIRNIRYTNTTDRRKYINLLSESKSVRQHYDKIQVQEAMEEFMYLGLRMIKGVSIDEFHKYFLEYGRTFEEIYGKTVKKLCEENLCIYDKKSLKLTERGIDISNYVMSEFLLS